MLKHKYSKSPNTSLNPSLNDTIEAGNLIHHDIIDDLETSFICGAGQIKTSTKRAEMEKDLERVWSLLGDAYQRQKARDQKYIKNFQTQGLSQEDSLLFHFEKTSSPKKKELSPYKRKPVGYWNNGDVSTNAVQEPWIIKYQYDQDGYKIYEDIELNTSNNKTLEGSFSSVSSSESQSDDDYVYISYSGANQVENIKIYEDVKLSKVKSPILIPNQNSSKKRSLRRSISKVFSRNKILRRI